MGLFEYSATEKDTYNKRAGNSYKMVLIVSLGGGGLSWLMGTDWKEALGIAAFVAFVQLIKSPGEVGYFISSIKMDDGIVEICYKKRSKKLSVNGIVSDFKFKKKIGFSSVKTAYLAVYHKGNLIIEQFEGGDWNEDLFDRIVAASENIARNTENREADV